MKRYILRITYDFGNHPVRYIYVHNSGSWYRDTKDIDAATRFYEKEVAEEYFDKIRKNPHYEFYYPEILEFDDTEALESVMALAVWLTDNGTII